MRNNNDYLSERVSPYGIRIHSNNAMSDLYVSTFVRDITCSFSILFSQSVNHHGFYTIRGADDGLKELFCFNDYLYLEYDFDKLLSSILYNLIFADTTFVEIAFSKNEKNEIVGISLFPFDAIKIASSKKHSWFISCLSDHKKTIFKLEKNKYIEFNIKELELRKNDLKRIVKKLKKIDINTSTRFLTDEKMRSKFSFDTLKRKQDILMLKYPKKIGWTGGIDNYFLNESYSLFREIKLREFQKKCLSLFIDKINVGLNNLCDIIKTSGTIEVTVMLPQYEKEWERYNKGEISSLELSNILFPKYSK